MVKSATKTKGAPLTSEEKLQLKEQSEKIAGDKRLKNWKLNLMKKEHKMQLKTSRR